MKPVMAIWTAASLAVCLLSAPLDARGGHTVNPSGECCRHLEFVSGGLLPNSSQSHVLGQYNYHGKGRDGTWTYKQLGGYERYLYFMGSRLSKWYISNELFQNLYYAHGDGRIKCPEAVRSWKFWEPSTGRVLDDPGARMVCRDDVGSIEEDKCLTSEACEAGGGHTTNLSAECCRHLELVSGGLLPDSSQSHVLGRYNYHGEGRDGTWTYKQLGGYERYLYFTGSGLSKWYIGAKLFQNLFYAHGDSSEKCPEAVQSWKFWESSTRRVLDDPGARMVCRDDAGSIEEDRCLINEACEGCSQTVRLGGVTYCCNNFCNSGSLSVNTTRDPPCQCDH